MLQPNDTIVIASGYMNPVHVGHIYYLREAKKLGQYLLVIINNDKQVQQKGSVPFMKDDERLNIVSELCCVDEVRLSIDTDLTVCATLISLMREYGKEHKLIFAKGGDRTERNIPEFKTCRDLGIEVVFGVGGGKIQSSSELIQKAVEYAPID